MNRSLMIHAVLGTLVLGGVRSVPASPVPNTWNFEGVLTDSNGQPIPDGSYDMFFKLYDNPSIPGGQLMSDILSVPVSGGHFSVQLDLGPFLDQFDELWLGIAVGAPLPEMRPRMRVTSTPGALGIPLPFGYDGSHTGPTLQVANSGSGPALRVEGLLNIGSPTRTGHLAFRTSALATPGFEFEADPGGEGGLLSLRDDAGNTYFEMGPEGTEGSVLKLWRNETDLGFVMRSQVGASPNPSLELHSAQHSVLFDMSQSGDASVQLYTDGISSVEMIDEPGCASLVQTSTFNLSTSLSTVAARTLVAPAAGYILAVATCEVGFSGFFPALATVILGLTAGSTLPGNQDLAITTPPGLSSSETIPVSVHGLFAVGTGNTTISLRGYAANGFTTATIRDVQITLVYIPTAYGTVSATAPDFIDPDLLSLGPAGEHRTPLTEAEVNRERAQEEARATVRLERELRLIKARTERLRMELDGIAAGRKAEGGHP